MPPKFDRCVARVMRQGKNKSSAYAICVAMWKRTRGKSPFEKFEPGDIEECEKDLQLVDLQELEKEMMKEEPEVFFRLQKELEMANEEENQDKKKKTLEELTGKSERIK